MGGIGKGYGRVKSCGREGIGEVERQWEGRGREWKGICWSRGFVSTRLLRGYPHSQISKGNEHAGQGRGGTAAVGLVARVEQEARGGFVTDILCSSRRR
jgi:hypothetical protein